MSSIKKILSESIFKNRCDYLAKIRAGVVVLKLKSFRDKTIIIFALTAPRAADGWGGSA